MENKPQREQRGAALDNFALACRSAKANCASAQGFPSPHHEGRDLRAGRVLRALAPSSGEGCFNQEFTDDDSCSARAGSAVCRIAVAAREGAVRPEVSASDDIMPICYGGPDFGMWSFPSWSAEEDMTAISMFFPMDRFLIAADGRCRSDDPTGKEKDKETDKATKIFMVEKPIVKMACAMSGFALTPEGFDTLAEYRQAATALPPSGFSSGYDYFHRICSNVKRAVVKAQKDGHIKGFPANDELPEDHRDRKFRLLALGYFRENPFWIEGAFYHDKAKDLLTIRMNSIPVNQPGTRCIGPCTAIIQMIYGNTTPDPRLAKYKKSKDNPLEYTTSLIEALSDPAAAEIEPLCASVGGHIHAAEVTREGARWLIPPIAQAPDILQA